MPYRITLFGNSSVGKSTIHYRLMSELKIKDVKFGYVEDICRRPPFDPNDLDKHIEARFWVIASQMANEMLHFNRKDMGLILSERSVLDWLVYTWWTAERLKNEESIKVRDLLLKNIETLVFQWAKMYDKIYYIATEHFKYVLDGFRPVTTMREDVEPYYKKIFTKLKKEGYPIIYVGGEIKDRMNTVLIDLFNFIKDKDIFVKLRKDAYES